MNTVIACFVVLLILLVFISLALALKHLIFKTSVMTEKTAEKNVVSFLTWRIIFSAILLILCYFYLSSLH
jgi:hypothetical protein